MTLHKMAEKLCRKYPDAPSLSLARRLYSENPEGIANLDSARSAIRRVRGAKGKTHAKHACVEWEKRAPYNPLKLPVPEAEDFTPYHLEGDTKAAIISDIHLPYHDLAALTVALQAAKKAKCDTLIILGDLLDFYQLSRFLKDPRARSVAEELNAAKDFLKTCVKMFPRVIWKYGNHDERFEHYMFNKAPELLDVPGVSLPELLGLGDLGVIVVDKKRPIYAGALTLLHGHELNGGISAPVNIARGLFLRAKACAIQGHNHQTSEHSEVDVRRKLVTTWSLGCLCYLHPEYARYNKWNHGFAFLDMIDGEFAIRNKRILDGRVL